MHDDTPCPRSSCHDRQGFERRRIPKRALGHDEDRRSGAVGVGTLSSRLRIRRRAERRLDRSGHEVVNLEVASMMSDLGGLWSIAHDDETTDRPGLRSSCRRQRFERYGESPSKPGAWPRGAAAAAPRHHRDGAAGSSVPPEVRQNVVAHQARRAPNGSPPRKSRRGRSRRHPISWRRSFNFALERGNTNICT